MLADGRVQETPALNGPFLDQGQVHRGKHHGAQFPNQGRSRAAVHAVEGRLTPAVLNGNFGPLFPVPSVKIQAKPRLPFAKRHQFRIFGAPERPASRKQPQPFQEVGFALGVSAADHIDPRAWETLPFPQVPILGNPQPLDVQKYFPPLCRNRQNKKWYLLLK